MPWVVLIAGLLEAGWAICLKYSRGFTVLWPSVGFLVFMLGSLYLLAVALKFLPLGTAYPVWTGIGAIGTVVFGILMLGESADPRRLACIGLILAGIVGLRIVSPHGDFLSASREDGFTNPWRRSHRVGRRLGDARARLALEPARAATAVCPLRRAAAGA